MEHAETLSLLPSRLPWDFHPALTEERLRICARLLANARRDALAMASYELGDEPWSVGRRALRLRPPLADACRGIGRPPLARGAGRQRPLRLRHRLERPWRAGAL